MSSVCKGHPALQRPRRTLDQEPLAHDVQRRAGRRRDPRHPARLRMALPDHPLRHGSIIHVGEHRHERVHVAWSSHRPGIAPSVLCWKSTLLYVYR